jgi:hypothetical protein
MRPPSERTSQKESALEYRRPRFRRGPVHHASSSGMTIPSQAPVDPCAAAETHWKAATSLGTVAAYEDHVARFPGCAFTDLARAKIEEMKKVAAVAPTRSEEGATTRAFDGNWDINIGCPAEAKALGYARSLSGTVKDGVLHAEILKEGTPNWLVVDGTIGADGKSTLVARGLTNDPRYTGSLAKPGTPYSYTVNAQFSAASGSGKRVELRPCRLTFVKR